MRKSLSQHLFSPLAIIQIVILSVLIVLALVLTTPLGPALIEKIANTTFTPLEIKGFRGSFLTNLNIASLKWEDPATTVELEQIKIEKPRYNIGKNQLNSATVSANRLVIRLPKSDNTPSEKITSLPDFALPVDIKTNALAIESFEVIRENEVIFQIKDIVLTKLTIEQGKLNAEALAAQLIIIGAPLDMKLQGFAMNMNQPHEMQGRGTADFKHPKIGKADANFEVGGTLVNYEFKLTGNLQNKQFSPQTLQLEGAGDYDQVAFSSIQTHSLEGDLTGKAEVKWSPELLWLFDGKLQQVKLAKHLPEWPAEFDATVSYQGGYKNNSLYGALDLKNLDGLLKGKKISAQGKLQHKDQQLTLDTVQADLGQNKIKASGKASPPFDLSWDIDATDLSQLLPDASLDLAGKLTAKGTLKGSLEQPLLNANINAENLRYKKYKLGSANFIAASKQGIYSLRGDLDQLDLDQQKITDAKLDASGTIENHQLKLAFTHTNGNVKLEAQGGWKAPQWKGSLQQLLLDTKQVSKWKLQQPVQISASKDQLKTSQFCLSNRSAHTCSTVQWSAKAGVNVEGDLKQTPLALLNPFLPKDIVLKGSANGRYKVKQQGDKIVADVALQLPAGLVSYGKGKNKQRLDYQSLTLKAILDGQKITANGKLLLKNKGKLSADATIVLAKTGDHHQIDAKGKLTRIPLMIARPWLPKEVKLNGSANGRFKLKQQNGKAVGDVALQLPASSVIMGEGKLQQRIDYKSLTVKALINGQKITAKTKLILKNKGELEANANIVLASGGGKLQIEAKGKLKRIPLLMAKPWLPKDIKLKGSASGNFNLKQKKGKAVGDVALQLPASSVIMGEGKLQQRIDYKSLTLKAIINGQKITANTKLMLKNRGELEANANIVLASGGGKLQIEAKGKLKRIPLLMAKPWLPKDIKLKGSASGNFNLKQKKGKAVGDVALQLPASSVVMGKGKLQQRIDYKSLTLKAIINGQKITANTKLMLKNRGELEANANIVLASGGGKLQIEAKGKLKRIPLVMAKPWLPKDIKLKGSASGNFNLKQKKGKAVGDVALQFPASSVVMGEGKLQQRIDYKSLTLKAIINGQKITANTKLMLKNRGELEANANIVLAGGEGKLQIEAKGKLKRIPLLMAKPWLPKEIKLNGSANGSFNLKQKNGKPVGDVVLQLPASSVVIGEGKLQQHIDYKLLTVKALINGQKITANTKLILKNRGELEANATILLASRGTDHQIEAKGKFKRIPLAMAKPWLPKGIQLNGNANGGFKLKQKNGKPVGKVSLLLPASSVLVGEGRQKQRIGYRSLTVNALINGQKITANSKLILKNNGELIANASILLAKNGHHRINAKGKLSRIPLAMVKPWLPKEIQLSGNASGHFDLKQQNGKAVGDVSLRLPASTVIVGSGRNKQRIDYQSLALNAQINGQKISANTKLLLKNRGKLTADATILLAKSGNHHRINVKGELNRIPLAMAKPWLPKDLQLSGMANGRFNLKPQNGKLVGDALLQLPASSVVVGQGRDRQRIDYKTATLKALLNGNKITANTKLVLKNNAELNAVATINLADKKNPLKINGKGKLSRMPLAMLQPWMPATIQLKGSANGQFNIKQLNGKPVGEVSLRLPASSLFVGEGKAKEKIDYRSLTLKALVNGNKITANTRLLLQNKGELSADATILLDSKGNHHQIDARGKLNRIPLAMAKPWLSETLTLNGVANGGFKLKQARGKTTGKLIIQLPRSSLSIMDDTGSVTKFDYQNAFVKAAINNKIVTANAKMQLNEHGNFIADAKILLGKNSHAHRIQGTASFDIPQLHWLQSFVPQTTRLYGKASSKVSFKGRLIAPKITGQMTLQDASLKLPKVGTHLRHINLTVRVNDANRAIINGSLVSGQGKATLTGYVSLKDPKKLNAEMRLRGSNLQFVNTHEVVGVMNPDITIKMNPKTVDIFGKIHIPTAKITLNAIPESSIDESEDVIVIGEKKADGNFSAVKIRPNIIVSLGNEVKFQGFGLDTKLGGSIRVTHNHQVIVAQGSIKINEGRYQAYGQNLTINNGRLVFNGPPTHIGMDIKAIRKVDDINAGIHLTGTLRKPKTKLFSSPSLSESNILSYLLTGHSMDEITGSQTALLMQAVRSMNVTGGDGLERSIGNSLGLDDLSIIPKDDLKKSELRLGKKLGSKLYVRYIVGIFDAAQKIALEYKVNKYLNLEAQVEAKEGANAQSLDLIYQVETD